MIFLTQTKCKIRFIYVRFNRKRKKWDKKMSGNLCHQGGIRRLMAKAIQIFHFDYLNPSLTHILWLEILIFLGAIHLVSKRYLCVLWCCSNNFHSYSHSFCTQSWWLSYIKKCRIDQIKSIKKKSSNKKIDIKVKHRTGWSHATSCTVGLLRLFPSITGQSLRCDFWGPCIKGKPASTNITFF